MQVPIRGSERSLAALFDVALLDLDGVVYVGERAVAGAPQALAKARSEGMRLAFVTNNASRTPQQVATHLSELGIPAQQAEVTTSSQAAAHYLADELPSGARVLVLGAQGLIEAIRERGLVAVFSADDAPAAVVQGYSPETNWAMLAEASIAIRRGALWVATNLDATLPAPRGLLPGNGSLVAALEHATGVSPVATGKPDPRMHTESVQRSGAKAPIVVGDRLDTDIAGACAVGCPSLLVFSGVTDVAAALRAPVGQRPDFLGNDVSALLSTHPEVVSDRTGWRCGQWQVAIDSSEKFTVTARPQLLPDSSPDDGLDLARALAGAVFCSPEHHDDSDLKISACDERSADALSRYGL